MEVPFSQKELESSLGAKYIKIPLLKKHTLTYEITPLLMFGGVPQCSDSNDFLQIKQHGYRIGKDGSYIYDSGVAVKGVEYEDEVTFDDVYDSGVSGDKESFTFCHYDVSIGDTVTNFKKAESEEYMPGEEYIGLVGIALETPESEI